ncbi:MAG: phosphoribosylaminoimidazolesuccinocarboxamide synthase [Planctomycetota bacterium]|nr:phosphoribosylaminoimidazolesuccinocarboxamide synthase [Planctomycetota bacterium]
MGNHVLLRTDFAGIPLRRGKVRDVYDLGNSLLMISTDRISAFDYILPNGIPDKGRILTQISQFWFDRLATNNHIITDDVDEMRLPESIDRECLCGRAILVKKAEVIPIECVVRGYLAGSGWKEYQRSQTICNIRLPSGLGESAALPEPLFTPATKAETGHDENISPDRMAELVGQELMEQLRSMSIDIYQQNADYARSRGIILADTKFEWGWVDGQITLVDEVLTPDSSRFWPLDTYAPGRAQASFDKQFVRDWLESSDWDKNSPPPRLPDTIVDQTRNKYIEAYERLTGTNFSPSS